MKYHCSIHFIKMFELICILTYTGYSIYVAVYEYNDAIYELTTVLYWKWVNVILLILMSIPSIMTFRYISSMNSQSKAIENTTH